MNDSSGTTGISDDQKDMISAFTSIPPPRQSGPHAKNADDIALCMRALESNGFRVTSLNSQEEVEVLRKIHKDIAFQVPEFTDRIFPHKYGPSLGAIFDACRTADFCAVTNADVYLVKSRIQAAMKDRPDRFLVARRADISAFDGRYIGTYGSGIDAVFFRPDRFAAVFEDPRIARFQLGAPFWDLIVPVAASFHGEVAFVAPPFLLHAEHVANWSGPDYDLLRSLTATALLEHAKANAGGSVQARRFLSIVRSETGSSEPPRTARQARAFIRVVSAWLERIEAARTVRIEIDPADEVLRRTAGDLATDLEALAGRESAPLPPRKTGSAMVDAIRTVLRRRRIARRRKRWVTLFEQAEREHPLAPD